MGKQTVPVLKVFFISQESSFTAYTYFVAFFTAYSYSLALLIIFEPLCLG